MNMLLFAGLFDVSSVFMNINTIYWSERTRNPGSRSMNGQPLICYPFILTKSIILILPSSPAT